MFALKKEEINKKTSLKIDGLGGTE